MSRAQRITFHRDAVGDWRWRWYAANGRMIGAATEGYVRQVDAVRNLETLSGGLVVFTYSHRVTSLLGRYFRGHYRQGWLKRTTAADVFVEVIPLTTARELYEANATDYPHVRWEALAPREKEGWEYAARAAGGVSVTRHNTTPTHLADTERAAAEAFLVQCGPCDGGLPMACACHDGDPRPVIANLLDAIDRLAARGNNTAHEARAEWERAVLERVIATMPACDQTPDFMHALSTAMLDTRAALSPAPTNEARGGNTDNGLRAAVIDVLKRWRCNGCFEPDHPCGDPTCNYRRELLAALDAAPVPTEACGERVAGGRCVMPAGHQGGHGQVGLR